MGQIIFITATDTAAGKTLLTAMLLLHLRQDRHVLAMKPFCAGGRGDVRILSAAQDDEITLNVLNPFHYREPVAPLVAARKAGAQVCLDDVLGKIRALADSCELLLVEGAGGLLVPLGEGYCVLDVIRRLRCSVLLVAPNKLGTVNHTLLSLEALKPLRLPQIKIILMGRGRADLASQTNLQLLAELVQPVEITSIPFLGLGAKRMDVLRENTKQLGKTLAQLIGKDILAPELRTLAGRGLSR